MARTRGLAVPMNVVEMRLYRITYRIGDREYEGWMPALTKRELQRLLDKSGFTVHGTQGRSAERVRVRVPLSAGGEDVDWAADEEEEEED